MKRALTITGLLVCMLLVFACGGGTATPTRPSTGPPTDTPSRPPTRTERPTFEPGPTDTRPPGPTLTPTDVPTVTATTPIGTPVTIRFIQMIDGATGWGIGSMAGDANHVLITQDGGSLWEDVTPPEPALATKHAFGYFYDRHTGWVTYYPTSWTGGSTTLTFYTWKTTNGGATWTQSATQSIYFENPYGDPPLIDFISASTGWILLRDGGVGMNKYPVTLLKTTNGGASWTIQIYGPGDLFSCPKTGMDFVDANTGWVTYDWTCPYPGPRVSATSDGGTTWSDIFLPDPTSLPGLFANTACSSHSPNLFSATSGAVAMSCTIGSDPTYIVDYLYVTTNGGASWIDVPYPGGPLYALDTATMFAMGQEQHRSTDGGVNWTPTSVVAWDGQFSFVTSLYIWGVAEASGSYALVKSINGTSSWGMMSPMVGP